MTEDQLILLQLGEECAEVAERVSKALRFTPGQVQPGQTLTNAERVKVEMLDVMSLYALLVTRGVLPNIDWFEGADAFRVKSVKINQFLALSRDLGVIQ